MQYSLFMIKPCAYDRKEEILNIIGRKLTIESYVDIDLDENFLSKLYKNEENSVYKKVNIQFLKDGKACIGVVSGENAIQDLIDICGDKPLGSMCKKETIRNLFSPDEDTIIVNNQVLYINAIHKSDVKDACDDVKLYYTYCNYKHDEECKSFQYKMQGII